MINYTRKFDIYRSKPSCASPEHHENGRLARLLSSPTMSSIVRARRLTLLLGTHRSSHLNQLITSGTLNGRFCVQGVEANTRQLHTSFRTLAPKAKTIAKITKLKQAKHTRDSPRQVPPRYVHGPTIPGLRIVVKALQSSETPMHSRYSLSLYEASLLFQCSPHSQGNLGNHS